MGSNDLLSQAEATKAQKEAINRDYICEPHLGAHMRITFVLMLPCQRSCQPIRFEHIHGRCLTVVQAATVHQALTPHDVCGLWSASFLVRMHASALKTYYTSQYRAGAMLEHPIPIELAHPGLVQQC